MIPLENINYWLNILLFIIPGTIIFSIRSLFIPIYDKNGASNIFRFIMYSSWNLLLSFLLIHYFSPNILVQKGFDVISNFKIFLLFIFFLPIIEGLIWSYVNTKWFNKTVIRPIFNAMKLNIINPAPTAWDSLFYEDKEKIIEIVFDTGETIIGYWGIHSYISSENSTRDIYLEKLVERKEDNTFSILEDNEGFLVNEEKIKYIRLYKIDSIHDVKIKRLYYSAKKIKNENKMLKAENIELKNTIEELKNQRKDD